MKLLLAIDESKYSEAATNAAMQLQAEQCEVYVLHVVKPPVLIPYAYIGEVDDLGQVVAEEMRRGKDLLDRAQQVLTSAGFRVQTLLERGDPRDIILDQAARLNVDLVIVGSHGLTGLDRFLIGSVSEAVLRHAHCSVEIVRILKSAPA